MNRYKTVYDVTRRARSHIRTYTHTHTRVNMASGDGNFNINDVARAVLSSDFTDSAALGIEVATSIRQDAEERQRTDAAAHKQSHRGAADPSCRGILDSNRDFRITVGLIFSRMDTIATLRAIARAYEAEAEE